MKDFTDEPNYTIELLEGRTTLEDVIDNHIYEQALVSGHHVHTHTYTCTHIHTHAHTYIHMHKHYVELIHQTSAQCGI